MDNEVDIINDINMKIKNKNLAFKVLENYHINMINLIDNYLENKELFNNCLNYNCDFKKNLLKNFNNYKDNDNNLIIYNDYNNKLNKIIYNSTRNLFHTSIYNYFNYIRKDYPYNTTELMTFIYIQQKKIDNLEKLIKKNNQEPYYIKLLFITSSLLSIIHLLKCYF